MPLITETTPARILALVISLLLLAALVFALFVFNKTVVLSLRPLI